MASVLLQKVIFRIRRHYIPLTAGAVRRCYWRLLGMEVGAKARLSPMLVTWPHKIAIGACCSFEHGLYFNAAGGHSTGITIRIGEGTFIGSGCEFNAIESIQIGKNCLIASGCRFIDHNHGVEVGTPMKDQPEISAPVRVGSDVWIGVHCVILKGVSIGDGAIIAAGSIVTKSVAPNSIVGGVPARFIRSRVAERPTATP